MEQKCSLGWEERCQTSGSKMCNCICGGANHGKKVKAFDKKDMRFFVPEMKTVADYKSKIVGVREPKGVVVYVDGKWLDPEPSLKVCNKSPDGFEWGYGGSGPAQLALAIALLLLPEEKALEHYQQFKWNFIANSSQKKSLELDYEKVKQWFAAQK